MVSSFHPHSMCKKVERVRAKTGCTSCTNWTISFEVSVFRTKKHICYNDTSLFSNLLQLQTFLRSVCMIQGYVINFQPFLASFAIFHPFTDFLELNDCEIENHYKMNSENVETWHGIIISPAQHVRKSREGHRKNWTHFVYKLDNLFRSIRVSDENSSVTRALQCF